MLRTRPYGLSSQVSILNATHCGVRAWRSGEQNTNMPRCFNDDVHLKCPSEGPNRSGVKKLRLARAMLAGHVSASRATQVNERLSSPAARRGLLRAEVRRRHPEQWV